jgi:hypothetical protein
MRTRQTVALALAIALATGMTMQPLRAGQGSGTISGVAKDAKKPYPEFSVRGRILEGQGAGNLTQPVPLDMEAKFNLTGIDLAKYQVELLNKKGEVVCTEGPFDLTKQPNRPDVVIDCGNPAAWWLLAAAAAAGITAGVVASGTASPAR